MAHVKSFRFTLLINSFSISNKAMVLKSKSAVNVIDQLGPYKYLLSGEEVVCMFY